MSTILLVQSRLFLYWFNQETNSVVFVYSVDEAWDVVGSPLITDVDGTTIILQFNSTLYRTVVMVFSPE